MTKRIPHCPHCGSDKIAVDAASTWSIDEQRFVLGTLHDVATCQVCDHECYTSQLDWRAADQPTRPPMINPDGTVIARRAI